MKFPCVCFLPTYPHTPWLSLCGSNDLESRCLCSPFPIEEANQLIKCSTVVGVGDMKLEETKAQVEHDKSESVEKQRGGMREWKSELASESEAIVRAEHEIRRGVTKEDFEELQRETEGDAERRRSEEGDR